MDIQYVQQLKQSVPTDRDSKLVQSANHREPISYSAIMMRSTRARCCCTAAGAALAMGITWRASYKYGAVWYLSTRVLFRPLLASRDVWMLRSIDCRCVLGGRWLCDRDCECSELVQ